MRILFKSTSLGIRRPRKKMELNVGSLPYHWTLIGNHIDDRDDQSTNPSCGEALNMKRGGGAVLIYVFKRAPCVKGRNQAIQEKGE